MFGVSILCGVGFTMSLFLGILAFEGEQSLYLIPVRLGVLCASVLSGLCGAFALSIAFSSDKKDQL
jgi:NhaA family Na+:H+ antiporter